jgi:hypothetical protein
LLALYPSGQGIRGFEKSRIVSTRAEYRWLPEALALVPLHWAATAGLVGDGIRDAESAMTAAEAWWSRRAELSS